MTAANVVRGQPGRQEFMRGDPALPTRYHNARRTAHPWDRPGIGCIANVTPRHRPATHLSGSVGPTMSYLLRVVIPDRPGMLGALASALGASGADIVSIDVVQRAGGEAVDDIVVELPPDRLPDGLITAARTVDGVSVESLRPFSGTLDTHRELALVEALAGSGSGVAQLLADDLPRIFRASWALLVGCPPPYEGASTVIAASAAAPEIVEKEVESFPWCPLTTPSLLDSEADNIPTIFSSLGTEMMAAPMGDPRQVVLVGRAGGPAFLRSELLRLAHLVGIAATVAAIDS